MYLAFENIHWQIPKHYSRLHDFLKTSHIFEECSLRFFDNDNPNCSFAGFLIQTGWQLTDVQKELCMCNQDAAECFTRKYDKKQLCLSPNDFNEIKDEEEGVDDIQMKNGLKYNNAKKY